MGVIVSFDYATWAKLYPEFDDITQDVIELLWERKATRLHRNDGVGPVNEAAQQTYLLELVTAHLATLYKQSKGDANPGESKEANSGTGRVTSATQGSVTVQLDAGGANMTSGEAYWAQTKYGWEYWQATRPYRTMRYMVTPQRNMNPWGGRLV